MTVAVVAIGFRGRTTHLASLIITVGLSLLAEALLLLAFGEIPRSYPAIADTRGTSAASSSSLSTS